MTHAYATTAHVVYVDAMSHTESNSVLTLTFPLGAPTSIVRRSMTSLIAPPPAAAKSEPPGGQCPQSKAHRRFLSLNFAHSTSSYPYPVPDPVSACASISVSTPTAHSRSSSCSMLSKIDTSPHSPDRPLRRPHGPRSACSPGSAVSSAKSASRVHFADIRKAKAKVGPGPIRTSPPQISLPYDADAEQDPLFNILPDQFTSHAPRRYCLKLIDIDPLSSDEDSPFDSLFSFTASPVESPSYTTTTFHPLQLSLPPALSVHSPNASFFSPISPNFVVRQCGVGDKVDRWIYGASSGLEPLKTPMIVDQKPHEFWEDSDQSDWRDIIDRFLQNAEVEPDDPFFPPTPGPAGFFPR